MKVPCYYYKSASNVTHYISGEHRSEVQQEFGARLELTGVRQIEFLHVLLNVLEL